MPDRLADARLSPLPRPQEILYDEAFAEYHKIVCYEELVFFYLHYVLGIKYVRAFLFDRFSFQVFGNRFAWPNNYFTGLISKNQIVSPELLT